MPRSLPLLFSLALLAPRMAFAQLPVEAPKTRPVAPSAPIIPQPGVEIPAPPEVDDPMLRAVPRATVEVATWEDALRHIRARSADLHIALDEVRRAEAQSRVALAGMLPTLTGTGALTHNFITREGLQFAAGGVRPVRVPFENYATGSLSLSQPVLALRAMNAIGTAHINEDAAKLSVDDTKRIIAESVANDIVAVVTAERVAELNRIGLRNALQRLDLTTRKADLGGATGLDVVRARQDVEVARSTLVEGDESLRQAREALGLALGLPEQVGVTPDVDIRGLEQGARALCRQAGSVDERADVAMLKKRAEIAHRNVNDVKAQFTPTLNLTSQLSTTTVNTGLVPNTTWNVQAVLSVPIWDGGARYGNLHDTQAQELQANERVAAQRRKATIEVTQARRAVSVADERRKVAEAARNLAADTDKLQRASFQEGRGTSLELVAAAQALRQAEIQLALRDFDTVKARVAAVLALATCPW